MTLVNMTLRWCLTRALLPKLFIAALALAWFAPGLISPTWEKGTDAGVMEIRPHAEGSPTALVAEHDCWTGEAPADMQGVASGHVVVTVDGATRLGGERMVGMALGRIIDGADHGLTVAGFCR